MTIGGRRVLVCLPLIAGLGWACTAAFHALNADHFLREARVEMATWRVDPARSTIQTVSQMLTAAAAHQPDEPLLHELAGHLALLGNRDQGPRAAEQGFVSALRLRPVSSYAWASLVQAKYAAGDAGRDLEYAIVRAASLGPSEPEVQRVIADVGLAVWPELSGGGQAAVDRLLGAGIRRNPLELLRISASRGRLDLACRHVIGAAATKRSGRYCERWEITP